MTNPTKQELIKFAKRNKIPMDDNHADVCIYKRQRDELINDIADIKSKAEAFDEIKEYTLDKIETLTTRQEFASNSNEFERFGNLLTAFKAVQYKIINLERGSDVESD